VVGCPLLLCGGKIGSPDSSELWCPAERQNSIQNAKRWLCMTNLSQHGSKTARNVSNPHLINVRFMFAPDMLWIGGVIYAMTGQTVREFRNPGCHEVVNVI